MKTIKKLQSPGAKARLRGLRPMVLIFCAVFAAVLLSSNTLAWFTASDSRANPLDTPQPKHLEIKLVDVFYPPEEPPGPGESFSKAVGAINTGTKPGFVRVLVQPVIVIKPEDPGEPDILLPATLGYYEEDGSGNVTSAEALLMQPHGLSPGGYPYWIYGGDGYWYYTLPLGPNENTGSMKLDFGSGGAVYNTNLFNSLILNPLLAGDSRYAGAQLKIEVKCEAAGTGVYRTSWWNTADDGTPPADPPHPAPIPYIDEALQAALA